MSMANLQLWPEMQPTSRAKKSTRAKGKPAYTEEFERDVWGPYPRKEGTSKANGFRKFMALDDEDRARVIATIPAYARSKAGREAEFICHLEFFISRRIFETIALPKTPPTAGPAPGIDWGRVLALYARTNNWNVELGPPPGSPGCRIPKEFLK